MKPRFSTIALCAAGILLTSCMKEMSVEDHSRPLAKGDFTAAMADAPETKTVLQGTHVVWSYSDSVAIFKTSTLPSRYHVLSGTEGSTDCTLRKIEEFGASTENGTSLPEYRIDDVVAYYPLAGVSSVTKSGSSYSLEVNIPATQLYQDESFGPGALPMVAVTNGPEETQLKFRNVLGFLKLDLSGNVPVKRIIVKGNAGEKLSGDATVLASNSGVPTVTMAETAVDSVVLSGGAAYIDCAEGSNIYIALPPVTFTNGITVTIETPWGDITKSTTASLEIKRSAVTSMERLEYMDDVPMVPDNEIWYISESGSSVELYPNATFGANLVSNECDGGFGIMRFDGPVTNIGSFNNSNDLKGIYLPGSVESIGTSAFAGARFKEITIPESVTSIGYNAFYYCGNLTSIEIPEGVVSNLKDTFNGCLGLKQIKGKNATADGSLWIDNGEVVVAANVPEITIPDGVSSIYQNVFYIHDAIQAVSIPSSCKAIGNYAFQNCTNLKTVTIAEGLESIGYTAFAYCRSLESITLPSSLKLCLNEVFAYCSNLKTVIFESESCTFGGDIFGLNNFYRSYTSGNYTDAQKQSMLASGTLNLETLVLPHTIEDGSLSDLYLQMTKFKDIVVPEGIRNVYLDDCASLESVTFPSTLGNVSISGCTSLKTLKGPNVTADGKTLIKDGTLICSIDRSEDTIVIPEGITRIGDCAYMGNTTIKNVVFPESLIEIGYSAFEGCTNLSNVIYPENVEAIGHKAFFGCSSLSSIKIPLSVESIGNGAFSNCASLERFEGKFASKDGKLLVSERIDYDSHGGSWYSDYTVISAVSNIEEVSMTSYESLTNAGARYPIRSVTFGDYAFFNCKKLWRATISIDRIRVGDSAFEGCEQLYYFTAEPFSSVGNRSFADCRNLNSFISNISLYDDAMEWGGIEAFKNTGVSRIVFKGLSPYNYDDGVRSGFQLPISCFENSMISSIEIPDTFTHIGTNCFKGSRISTCTLPSSLRYINNGAFMNCTSLRSLNIPASVSYIGQEAFANSGLNSLDLSSTAITSLGSYAFQDCVSLQTVKLPSMMQYISFGLFKDSGIRYITLVESIMQVANEAFSGCKNLERVNLECISVPTIFDKTFENNAEGRVFVVPSYMYDKYRTSENWKQFAKSIVTK